MMRGDSCITSISYPNAQMKEKIDDPSIICNVLLSFNGGTRALCLYSDASNLHTTAPNVHGCPANMR
jgi:hypothetical protein